MSGTSSGARVVSVAIHGGAWAIPDAEVDTSVAGVRRAAQVALKLLQEGRCAMDAVEAAVRVLEDDPVFDAGTGSVLNAEGNVEMDALLMDGETLKSGAVVGIDCVRHPITVARQVMALTPHQMFAGEGAKAFARRVVPSDEVCAPLDLVTEGAKKEWQTAMQRKTASGAYTGVVAHSFDNPSAAISESPSLSTGHDTVGCVCVDKDGHVASGTSTGGITAKMPGRVGDSALVGAGGYADDACGAASTTGHGESIMRVLLAKRAVDGTTTAPSAAMAAAHAVAHMRDRVSGYGGVIVVTPRGDVGVAHSTSRMACAWGNAPATATAAATESGTADAASITACIVAPLEGSGDLAGICFGGSS
jgi:beta-aspartyl-peptidase (threonine type)